MRIRSIKPEFWSSEDIAALDWHDRLIFLGLWSYVDDNGVGRDNEKLIVADLFPLEDDPRETVARVSRALLNLSEAGLIARYIDQAGKPYLWITGWAHQRIDKPAKARYPLPTSGNTQIRETVATPSRDRRDTLAPGTGEQGNREQGTADQGNREQRHARATPTAAPEPPHDDNQPPTLTQLVLTEFVAWLNDNHHPQPPSKVRAALAAQVRALLPEEPPADILAGLQLWQTKGATLGAGLLPNLVHEARSKPTPLRPRRQVETDAMFDAAMERAIANDRKALNQ